MRSPKRPKVINKEATGESVKKRRRCSPSSSTFEGPLLLRTPERRSSADRLFTSKSATPCCTAVVVVMVSSFPFLITSGISRSEPEPQRPDRASRDPRHGLCGEGDEGSGRNRTSIHESESGDGALEQVVANRYGGIHAPTEGVDLEDDEGGSFLLGVFQHALYKGRQAQVARSLDGRDRHTLSRFFQGTCPTQRRRADPQSQKRNRHCATSPHSLGTLPKRRRHFAPAIVQFKRSADAAIGQFKPKKDSSA